jgi:hypothetical protein
MLTNYRAKIRVLRLVIVLDSGSFYIKLTDRVDFLYFELILMDLLTEVKLIVLEYAFISSETS